MADIQKLSYPYFTDNTTALNATNLNPIIAKLNEVIDKVNGGVTPTQTVATPTISISGTSATITCSTSDATIRYTTNDSTPSHSNGTVISSGDSFTIPDGTTYIKAIAYKDGMNDSQVASQPYSPASPLVYKTYASTNGQEQYVNLSSLTGLASLTLDNVKTEVQAMLVTKTNKCGLFSMKNKYAAIVTYDSGNKILFQPVFSTSGESVTSELNHLYVIDQNTKTGVCHVDNVEFTPEAISTSSTSQYWALFNTMESTGEPSTSYYAKDAWKLKSFKVYNATTNELVAEIVPATYNGTACLYDKVTDTPLYPNSGTLAVE